MAAVETRRESKHWKLRLECVLEYALTIFLKEQFQKLCDSEANTEKPGIIGGDVAKPHLEVSTTVGLCTLLLILQFCFPRHSPRLGEMPAADCPSSLYPLGMKLFFYSLLSSSSHFVSFTNTQSTLPLKSCPGLVLIGSQCWEEKRKQAHNPNPEAAPNW